MHFKYIVFLYSNFLFPNESHMLLECNLNGKLISLKILKSWFFNRCRVKLLVDVKISLKIDELLMVMRVNVHTFWIVCPSSKKYCFSFCRCFLCRQHHKGTEKNSEMKLNGKLWDFLSHFILFYFSIFFLVCHWNFNFLLFDCEASQKNI